MSGERGLVKQVLLTGATGFVGCFVLEALLRETPATTIVCFVRADNDVHATARLEHLLAENHVLPAAIALGWQRRVRAVAADISLSPLMGLGEETYRQLADATDLVVHVAAQVHSVMPYSRLKAANVEGTRNMLRLADRGARSFFAHVSTVGVVGRALRWVLHPQLPQ